jgi:hypothetical protein
MRVKQIIQCHDLESMYLPETYCERLRGHVLFDKKHRCVLSNGITAQWWDEN